MRKARSLLETGTAPLLFGMSVVLLPNLHLLPHSVITSQCSGKFEAVESTHIHLVLMSYVLQVWNILFLSKMIPDRNTTGNFSAKRNNTSRQNTQDLSLRGIEASVLQTRPSTCRFQTKHPPSARRIHRSAPLLHFFLCRVSKTQLRRSLPTNLKDTTLVPISLIALRTHNCF